MTRVPHWEKHMCTGQSGHSKDKYRYSYIIKEKKRYRDLYPDEQEMLSMPPLPKGVIGVTPGLVGCVEAHEVIKIICGYGTILAGKLWQIDLKTMETYTILL